MFDQPNMKSVLKQPAHSIAEKNYERETVTKSKYKTKNEVPDHGKFLASPRLQGQLADFVVPANKHMLICHVIPLQFYILTTV